MTHKITLGNIAWIAAFIALALWFRLIQTGQTESSRELKQEMDCTAAVVDHGTSIDPCLEMMRSHELKRKQARLANKT